MLFFSGKDVVLLQPTESDHQIINRTLGEFNTVVTCTFILYFTFLTTSEAVWYIILVPFVCLSVCMSVCQTITFESLDVGSSYLHT